MSWISKYFLSPILISDLYLTKVHFLLSFLPTNILYHPIIPVLVLSLFYRQGITFLGTNSSFKSIMWSHISIFSLTFFSKTLINLWNYSSTNFFTFSSNLTAFSLSSQISHSFTTFFISIISFYFCHSNFPYFSLHCFLHSFGYLVIIICKLCFLSVKECYHCRDLNYIIYRIHRLS